MLRRWGLVVWDEEMKKLFIVCAVLLILPCLASASTLPDTGQTKCYDNYGYEINPCPQLGEDFYGQDAQYITNPQSFTKLDENGNDLLDDAPWPWAMVRDNVTGLIWEVKNSKDGIPDYNNPHDADNYYTWCDSDTCTTGDGTYTFDFINELNSTQFGGYSDWRLPTIKEFPPTVNRDTFYPSITVGYFPHTKSSNYWTSTISALETDNSVWISDFSSGLGVRLSYIFVSCFVRAVRGETVIKNFIDNSDGTISDATTGLMWEQKTDDGGIQDKDITSTWEEALVYCENLSSGRYNDWRLPNINEIQSILDYEHAEPAIDILYFPNTIWSAYWSATTRANDVYSAWGVNAGYGNVSSRNKSFLYYVRAVRGGLCGLLGDFDGDTVCDDTDNCPDDHNPFQIDCDNDGEGDICDVNTIDPDGDGVDAACDNCPATPNPNQADTYPPQGNVIGDACDCECDFDCSGSVDANDVTAFLMDFGRSTFNNPCTNAAPCNGDVDCNGNCDANDVTSLLEDFGRSQFNNPCPACEVGDWCVYP
jgi:hypothetical protein